MSWNQRGVITMREEFVQEALEKALPISVLCEKYSISRPTAYKWISRYQEEGFMGLCDRPKRPVRQPSRTSVEKVDLIVSCREKYKVWGAKKIRQVLINQGYEDIPSVSTINRIFKQEGKITPEESAKRTHYKCFERENPNELWQMDFKGKFNMVEGLCYPLTVLDDCSRFSLCLTACVSENERDVKHALQATFEQYGLPDAMTMDNGSPWKGYATQKHSTLTVWLMRLGIRVGHSRPGHPQTQGKDERFHRSLKEELLKFHNFQDLRDAQRHFDEWREVYNCERPHEALGMQCPAQRYRVSGRSFPSVLPRIEYASGDGVVKVGWNGEMWFKGERHYVGRHFAGEPIALRERSGGRWDMYYVKTRIGGFSEKV